MSRYMPYMDVHDDHVFSKNVNETRTKDVIRAVAIVSTDSIPHGDELFADYLEDERAEIDFTPDWLIKPPDNNPYLKKKQMISYVPFITKLIIAYEENKKGRTFDEFESRTKKELPPVQATPR